MPVYTIFETDPDGELFIKGLVTEVPEDVNRVKRVLIRDVDRPVPEPLENRVETVCDNRVMVIVNTNGVSDDDRVNVVVIGINDNSDNRFTTRHSAWLTLQLANQIYKQTIS